jgi:hypothetical protein
VIFVHNTDISTFAAPISICPEELRVSTREACKLKSVGSVVLLGVLAFAGVLILEVRSDEVPSVAAAPAQAPACPNGYGAGGVSGTTQSDTTGGHGCVVIAYVDGGTTVYETFAYTGALQTWTVPAGVESATFTTYGAGGGGTNTGPVRTNATNAASWYSDASVSAFSVKNGGKGGSATGTFVLTPGETLSILVGQGGIGNPDARCLPTVTKVVAQPWLDQPARNTDLNEARASFGGGARAKSHYNTRAFWQFPLTQAFPERDDDECINPYFASGGGRSEVLLGATRLIAAGGGGGAGFYGAGGTGADLAAGSASASGGAGAGLVSCCDHDDQASKSPTFGSGGSASTGGSGGLSSQPTDLWTRTHWNNAIDFPGFKLPRVNGQSGVAGFGGASLEGGGGGGGGCFGGGGGGDGGGGGGGSSCLLGSVISRFTTTSPDDTYVAGDSVDITAMMSKPIADGAVIEVTLDTGETVTLVKTGPYTMSGTYVVGANATSADLTVVSYSLTTAPVDVDGITMTSTVVPSGAFNIAGAHAIVIGAAQPNPAPAAPAPAAPAQPDPVPSDLSDPSSMLVVVSEVTVFEDAGWAEFEVTGPPAMAVRLVVESGTASIGADFGDDLQVFDGRSWRAYEPGSYVSLDAAGVLLVRVPIIIDVLAEDTETFRLIAISQTELRAEGIGRILDSVYMPPAVGDTTVGTPLNTPYSGTVLGSGVGMELEVVAFSVQGIDGVFAAGEVITVAGVGTLVINADGSYEFTPAWGFVGDVPEVTFTVRDRFGLTASGLLSIEVGSVLPRTGAELREHLFLAVLLVLFGLLMMSGRRRDSVSNWWSPSCPEFCGDEDSG